MNDQIQDLPGEIWQQVEGYDGRYMASNKGRIKLIKGGKNGKRVKILNPYITNGGYASVKLYHDFMTRAVGVHQVITDAFIGKCPVNHEVNHKDGNKLNNSIDNLEYVTRAENIHHADDLGLRHAAYGEKHGRSKLNRKKVRNIRRLIRAGGQQSDIADRFGVSPTTITEIKQRKIWKHIE